jgi:hypothetical protein
MPDDLYERDIVSWSEQQAVLLRRVARGERVNGVDWEHVVEEIEDLGLAQITAVGSYLRLMMVHLLKLTAWPEHTAARHWREEIAAFQASAVQRFVPSMRQRIDVDSLYGQAIKQLRRSDFEEPVPKWPTECPVGLDLLLDGDIVDMTDAFAAAITL